MDKKHLKEKAADRVATIVITGMIMFFVIITILALLAAIVFRGKGYNSGGFSILFSITGTGIILIILYALIYFFGREKKFNDKSKSLEDRIYNSMVKKENLKEQKKQSKIFKGTLSVSRDNSTRGKLSKAEDKSGRMSKK